MTVRQQQCDRKTDKNPFHRGEVEAFLVCGVLVGNLCKQCRDHVENQLLYDHRLRERYVRIYKEKRKSIAHYSGG